MTDHQGSDKRLRPGTSISDAAAVYLRWLESERRPPNTIKAYQFDLRVLARQIPQKSISRITAADISRFLGNANSSATRKRRLTSLRQFYRYLIDEAKVVSNDPTADVYPNRIDLKPALVLDDDEQAAILSAGEADEPWAFLAISLMMQTGLTRAELLDISRGAIDRSNPDHYLLQITTDDLRRPYRTRTLRLDGEFPAMYEAFLEVVDPGFRLFPFGFQAINGMVDRVRRRAGIERVVSPRTLRDTSIATRFRNGMDEDEILKELGLAPDLRNRQSIRRFRPAAQD